jgi:chromosome segregation ATPase
MPKPPTFPTKPVPSSSDVKVDAAVPPPIFNPQNIPSLGVPLSSSPLTTDYTVYRNAESDLAPFQRDMQIALEEKRALKKELELKEIELQNKVKELAEANIQVSNWDKRIAGRNAELSDKVQEIDELEADIREYMREVDRLKGVIEERDEEIDGLKGIVEGRLEEDSDGDNGDDDVDMDGGGRGLSTKVKTLKLKQALNVCEGKKEMLEGVVNEQAEKIVQMQEVMEGKQIPDFWAKMREVKAKNKALEERNRELEEFSSETLQSRIKELEAELMEVKEDADLDLEDLESTKKLKDILTNENKNLRRVLAEGDDKRADWVNSRVGRLEEQNAALKAELEEKDKKIEELEHEASERSMGQDHSVNLQTKDEECQKKLAKLQTDSDAALRAKAVEIDGLVRKDQELRKAHEVAERSLAQIQEEKRAAEKNVQEYRNENARLEKDYAMYRAQIEELQRQLAQAQQTQQNVANGDVDALNAQIRQMTEAATQVVAERDAYLKQIEQLNAEVQRLNALGMAVEEQRNEAYSNRDQAIKERDEIVSKLNDALVQSTNLQQQLQQSQQLVVQLQNQLAAAQMHQHQSPVEDVDTLLTEVAQLRQQLTRAQQSVQNSAALQQEIVRLKEQVEIEQKAGEAVEVQRVAAVEELEEAQNNHRIVRAELADAKARVPGLEGQVQDLQAQLVAAKDMQLALTTEDGKAMFKRLCILEKDNADLLVQQNKDKIQRETDKIRVNGFTKEIAQLHAQLAAANTQVNANGQEGLSQELTNLHGQVQQLQAELAEAQKYIPEAKKLPLCDQEVRRQRGLLAQRDAELADLKDQYLKAKQAQQEHINSKAQDDQIIAKKKGGQQYGPQVVKELREKLDKMQIQLATAQGPEIIKKNAEIERLRVEVAQLRAELHKQKTVKVSVEEVDAQKYFEENVELKKTIEELELELQLAIAIAEDKVGNIGQDDSMGATPPRADRSAEIGDLQQQNNGLTAQLADKNKELEEKTKNFEQEYARFNQVHAELTLKANLNSGNGGNEEEVQQMQQEFMGKVQELERATKKVTGLEKQLEETKTYANKMYEELQEKHRKAEADLADYLAGRTGIQSQAPQIVAQLENERNVAMQEVHRLQQILEGVAQADTVGTTQTVLQSVEWKKKADDLEQELKVLKALCGMEELDALPNATLLQKELKEARDQVVKLTKDTEDARQTANKKTQEVEENLLKMVQEAEESLARETTAHAETAKKLDVANTTITILNSEGTMERTATKHETEHIAKLQDQEKLLAEALGRVEELQSQMTQLQAAAQHSAATEALSKAKQKVTKLESEQKAAHSRIAELDAEHKELQNKWQTAYVELQEWARDKTKNPALITASERMSQLEAQLYKAANPAANTQDTDSLKGDLDARVPDVKNLKNELEAAEQKNKALTALNSKLRRDIKSAKEEAEKEKSKGIDFESRLPQLQQEALDPTRNPALADATRKIDELQEQLGKAIVLEEAHKQAEKRLSELEAALNEKNEDIAALPAVGALQQCEDKDHAEKFSKLEEELRRTIADLEKRLADCHEHGKKLEAEMDAKRKELESVQTALNDAQVELKSLRANLNKPAAELQAGLERTKNQLEEKREDYNRVVKKNDEANRELTDAVTSLTYIRSFPHGHVRLPTSSTGLHCGLYAIIESVKAQMPLLPVPTLSDLQRIISTVTEDPSNFQAEHLHLTLRKWAEEQQVQQSLQLGIITPETCYLVWREDGRNTLWLHNDEAKKLQKAEYNHYEGLRAKPCGAGAAEADHSRVLTQRTEERDAAVAQADQMGQDIKGVEEKLADQESKYKAEKAALRLMLDTSDKEKKDLAGKVAELQSQLTEQESKCKAEEVVIRQLLDTCNKEKNDVEAELDELQTQLATKPIESGSFDDAEGSQAKVAKLERQLEEEKNKVAPSSAMEGPYQASESNFSLPECKKEEGPEPQPEPEPEQQQTDTPSVDRSRAPSPEVDQATTDEPEPSAHTPQDPVDAGPREETADESDKMDIDLPDYESTPERKPTNDSPADPFGSSNPFRGFLGTSTGGQQQSIFGFFQSPPPPPTSQPPSLGKDTRGSNKRHHGRGRGHRPEAADFMGSGVKMQDQPGTTSGTNPGASPFFGSFGSGFHSNASGPTESGLHQQIAELNSQLFHARTERSKFEQERNKYETALRRSTKEAHALNVEVTRMHGEREKDQKQFETEKLNLVTEHDNVLAGLTARVNTLESEKSILETEVARLEAKSAEQELDHVRILEMVKQGDGTKTTKIVLEINARLGEQLKEKEERIKELDEANNDCLEVIEELERDVTKKEADIERLTDNETKFCTALAELREENGRLREEITKLKVLEGYKNAFLQQYDEHMIALGEILDLKTTIAKKVEDGKWTLDRLGQLQKEKDHYEETLKYMGEQTKQWQTLMEKQNAEVDRLLLQLEKARAGKRPTNSETVDNMDDDEVYAIEKVYKLEKLIDRLLSYRFQRQFMTDFFDKVYEQIRIDRVKGTPATKKHLKELVVEEWLQQMISILPPSEPNVPGWARPEILPDGILVDEEGEVPQSAENRELHEQKLRDCAEENLVQRLQKEIHQLEAKLESNNAAAGARDASGEEKQAELAERSKQLQEKDNEIAELKARLAEALAAPATLEDLLAISHQILDRVNSFESGSATAAEKKETDKQTPGEAKCPCYDCCKCKSSGAVVAGESDTAIPENMVDDLQDTVTELSKMMQGIAKDFKTEVETAKEQLPAPVAVQSDGVVTQLQKELRQAKDRVDGQKMDLSNAQMMLESHHADIVKTEVVSGDNIDIAGRLAEAQQQIRDLQARVDDGKPVDPKLYQDKGRAEVLQQQVAYLQKELDKLDQQFTQEREALNQQGNRQKEQFDKKLDEEREKVAALQIQLVTDKSTPHVEREAATSSSREQQVAQPRPFGRRTFFALFVAMAATAWCVYMGMEASADLRTGVGSIYHYGRAQTHQVMVFKSWEMFGIFELYQSYVCYCLWRLAFAISG